MPHHALTYASQAHAHIMNGWPVVHNLLMMMRFEAERAKRTGRKINSHTPRMLNIKVWLNLDGFIAAHHHILIHLNRIGRVSAAHTVNS